MSGLPLGGTRLSGPAFDVRSSIPLQRGLNSRAESGAKAPHSMECGDLSPLSGEGFSLHNLTTIDPDKNAASHRPVQEVETGDLRTGRVQPLVDPFCESGYATSLCLERSKVERESW